MQRGYVMHTTQFFELLKSNHVCLVWNSSKKIFYVNGVFDNNYGRVDGKLIANRFVVGNDLDPINDICVVNDPSQSFRGEISNLNIWNRVLNVNEIGNVYSNGYVPKDNLAVSWEEVLNFNTTTKIKKRDSVV